MKHEPKATANALAFTVAVFYIVCRMLVGILPGLSMAVAQSWFHGLELSKVSNWNLSMGWFILGLITSTAIGWLSGYIFAKAYNYFLAKKG